MAFTGSRTITIDHTKCGAANSTDFPVLFAGTYAYLATVANGGSVTSSSGHDICFFSDSGLTTALDWELVEYDPTTGKLEAHVRVGTLSASTDTVFYLGFGDSGITTFQGDVAGTWNSGFALVAHLPNGTTLSANDSTTNANNGTVTNAVAAAGKIGGGASFDGAGDSINFGSGSSLDTLTTQTIEMWIKRGSVSTTTDQHIASKEWNDGSGFGGWWFYLRRDSDGTHGGKLKFGRGWSGSTYESALWRASTPLNSTSPWYHCVVTYDAGSTSNNPIIYLNGVAETTTNEQAPSGTLKSDNPYNVRMGEGSYGENDYNGTQDEFRVSNVVRNADWILATYNNHNDPSTFYAITGGGSDYTLTASGGALTLTGYAATLSAFPTIVLDPATTYQTMQGWEVTAQGGDTEVNYTLYADSVIELGAQYGVDAVRLEIQDQWETSDGVYDWSVWAAKVPTLVLPLKEAMARHGRTMRLNLCYVAFGTHSGLHTTAANYADFILAAVQHLDTTYGLVPDTIEIILEPDNGPFLDTGAEIGAAVKATGDLLATNGYTPGFIIPSVTNMGNAASLYDSSKAVSGAPAYITMLSYHRYGGVSDVNLAAILSRVNADSVASGMLEHIASGAEDLWADVTKANASLWQQYCLAFPTSDDGAQLFPVISDVATIGSRTPGLSQYFKYVRRGAERIATSSLSTNVRPVAFVNTDGRYAVVIHADATGTYTVGPVPTGAYFVTRSSATAARSPLGVVMVAGDGIATLSLNSGDIATLAPIEGAAGGRLRLSGGDATLTLSGVTFTARGLWFTR